MSIWLLEAFPAVHSIVNIKNISYYHMVGNFVGTNFTKQVNIRVSVIFAVLIFMVSEFGTCALASCMARS